MFSFYPASEAQNLTKHRKSLGRFRSARGGWLAIETPSSLPGKQGIDRVVLLGQNML